MNASKGMAKNTLVTKIRKIGSNQSNNSYFCNSRYSNGCCKNMKFYDREAETAALKKYEALSAKSAQMIVMTGRRRIGKTTLIKHSLTEIPFLYFFVGRKSESLLCRELVEIVHEVLDEDPGDFTSFKRLFAAIMMISKRRNFTLVLDEFQNFKVAGEGIFSDIQDVWDSNKDGSMINLVICGSIYSKMKKIFDDKEEPLYGRATARFRIKPFSTRTLMEIIRDYNPEYTPDDLLAMYMVTGGVAKYVELLIEQNAFTKDSIMEAVVSTGSYFIDEGKELLTDELGKDYGNYFSVLAALAGGNTYRSDMTDYVGFETGGYLDKLEKDFDAAARVRPYLAGENTHNVRYCISDNFLNFWFRFIYKYRSAVEIGNMEYVREKITSDYETFSGHILESWFRQAFKECGRYNIVTNYWEKGRAGRPGENNEIDLVAINKNDRVIVLGECKRNPDKFNLKRLQEKSVKILSHHNGWKVKFVSLSLENLCCITEIVY